MNKKDDLMYDSGDYVCDNCGEISVNSPMTLCEECLKVCIDDNDL